MSIACSRLQLTGRAGGSGVFKAEGPVERVNLLDLLHRSGVRPLLQDVVVWAVKNTSVLTIHLATVGTMNPRALEWSQSPTITTAATSMLALVHTRDRGAQWEAIVERMVTSQQTSVYDIPRGALALADGEVLMEVEQGVLSEMVAAGVLLQSVSVFGEAEYTVATNASSWSHTFDLSQGTRDALAHLESKPTHHWCKLDMILMLARHGWVKAALTSLNYFTAESDKRYQVDTSRPKLYYAALLAAQAILSRLPVAQEQLPCIYHGLPASYYQVLLTGDRDKLHRLLALMDEDEDPNEDDDAGGAGGRGSNRFQALLGDADVERDDVAAPEPALLALPAPPVDREQIMRDQKMAWQVIRAVPSAMINIVEHWHVDVWSHTIKVHLDNASHSSGNQRVYVACCGDRHGPCFKYKCLKDFASTREAVAWCAAWAFEPKHQPQKWPKANHLAFVPPADRVTALMAHAERV